MKQLKVQDETHKKLMKYKYQNDFSSVDKAIKKLLKQI